MKNDRKKNTLQLLARMSYIHPYIFHVPLALLPSPPLLSALTPGCTYTQLYWYRPCFDQSMGKHVLCIERCRDGCRTSLLIAGVVLVPVIFHTSLPPCHPNITIYFVEMIFPTCSTNFLEDHRYNYDRQLLLRKTICSTLHQLQGHACSHLETYICVLQNISKIVVQTIA